jgi:hypothetical protein
MAAWGTKSLCNAGPQILRLTVACRLVESGEFFVQLCAMYVICTGNIPPNVLGSLHSSQEILEICGAGYYVY